MPQPISKWRTIWITGASSGIGHDLALRLARMGATVAASARSADKLDALCALEPNIKSYPLDVTDLQDVLDTATKIKADLGELDLVILNAGTYERQRSDLSFSAKQCTTTMAVNYNGVVHGVEAVLPDMVANNRGHIAVVASVAGFRGLPNGSSYSPTKAACIALCEALTLDLAETDVKISVINPGFVKTPLVEGNDFPMPFIISSDEAATHIIEGLESERFDITFPWKMRWLMNTMRTLPNAIFLPMAKSQIKKQRAARLAKKKS